MKSFIKPVIAAVALIAGGHAMAQISFYEGEGYRGRAFSTQQTVRDFTRFGFNDSASSVVVDRGRYEVCEDVAFQGRCVVLRRGSYDSLRSMGFNNRISSVRPIGANARYAGEAPEPVAAVPDYQYRRRANERTFEVPVQTVRAVVGPPEQRCWMERQAVTEPSRPTNQPNIGGALVGGLIGGILGHQVGGGSGKDIATAGGAVGGAVIGSNIANRQGYGSAPVTSTRDVQKCQNVTSTTPAYWDVTYSFRGQPHSVQMATAPGPTIVVNGRGEPRQ